MRRFDSGWKNGEHCRRKLCLVMITVWLWACLFAESARRRAGCVCVTVHKRSRREYHRLDAVCVEAVSKICQPYSLYNKCGDEASICITTSTSRINSLWRRQVELARSSALEAEWNLGECWVVPVNVLYFTCEWCEQECLLPPCGEFSHTHSNEYWDYGHPKCDNL
jgi:hypothetical protein